MVGSAHPTAATVAELKLVFSFLEISLGRQQLPQDVGQNAAVAKVLDFV